MRLETWHSAEERRRWKIVRTDTYTDVPGEIISADEATGECCLQITVYENGQAKTETKQLSYGPNGIRICPRKR